MNWRLPKTEDLFQMIESWQSESDVKCMADNHEAKAWREILLAAHEQAKKSLDIQTVKGHEYKYDLLFGLQMYESLNISESTASDDKFWIYLSIFVVPEVVFWRWGPSAHDRFYNNPRRIWLKVIWWYIHLSWQGNRDTTFQILENNSTDIVVQLVERSGPYGYRVKLCRTIMKVFDEYCRKQGKEDRIVFRKLMKLNTARLAVMEPALCEGEETGYVKQLFAALGG